MPSNFNITLKKILFFETVFFLLGAFSESKMDYETKFKLAQEHYERVLYQISCGTPQPRVFKVETPRLRVSPSATVLYRCGARTGCCDTLAERCVAKTTEKVELFFFVKTARRRKGSRQKIKKFVFSNHTECHCVDKRNIPR